jgi:hypothetical protein
VQEVVEQITSPNGKRRFTVYRREDGLFFYREAWYAEWDDAPHAWLDGYPPSGLFASAADADADARSTIHWLRQS